MKPVLITFDLHTSNGNYKEISNKIIELSNNKYLKELETTWIIISDLSPMDLRAQLIPLFRTSGAKLFVALLDGDAAWFGINDSSNKWLVENV